MSVLGKARQVQVDLRTLVAAKPEVFGLALALSGALLCLYLVTNIEGVTHQELSDHAFGADPPFYVFGQGVPEKHPLMTKILIYYRKLLAGFGLSETPPIIKAPYAIITCANVVVAMAAFSALFKRFDLQIVLYGACYGVALIIWFYGSNPESYALTTLLYSVYLLIFLHGSQKSFDTRHSIALALSFLVGMYNEVAIVVVAIVPAILYGKRLATDRGGRQLVYFHAAALGVYFLHQVLRKDLIHFYWEAFTKVSPLRELPADVAYELAPLGVVMNFFFYSLAAPSAKLTYAPWLAVPTYKGYFDPSPLSYFHSLTSIPFIGVYLALISFVRWSKTTRLVLALSALVGVRFVLACLFNPVESIMYSSVATLPMLLVLFRFLEESEVPFKTLFATGFLLSMLLANGRFFLM